VRRELKAKQGGVVPARLPPLPVHGRLNATTESQTAFISFARRRIVRAARALGQRQFYPAPSQWAGWADPITIRHLLAGVSRVASGDRRGPCSYAGAHGRVTSRKLRFFGLTFGYLPGLQDASSIGRAWARRIHAPSAVARRLPRPTIESTGARCNRRVTALIREFDARGWAVRKLRAATSVRRAGVMPTCSLGLPRVAGGREGDRVSTWACGWRVLLVAARRLAMQPAADRGRM